MRIISGTYKNKLIPFLQNSNYRPSTAKLRESIFNILFANYFLDKSFNNVNVLDLFAGTGSLAFEALSRGAKSITLIENNRLRLKIAKNFFNILNTQDIRKRKGKFLFANALNLPYSSNKYNLIFIDPPYYKNFLKKSIINLIKKQWICNKAIIVAEIEKNADIPNIKFVNLVKEKKYNNNKILIFHYNNDDISKCNIL